MLTQARLKEVLRYDDRTGEFYWLVQPGSRGDLINRRAGCLSVPGYWVIVIDGKHHRAHRLAWLYVHGYFPKELDHKNRIKTDNRIANLREANRNQNLANQSREGLKGAYKRGNKWQAKMRHNNKTIHLGTFNTPQAAHAAYCHAAKKQYGKFFYSGS
jgi:hypothetical protein